MDHIVHTMAFIIIVIILVYIVFTDGTKEIDLEKINKLTADFMQKIDLYSLRDELNTLLMTKPYYSIKQYVDELHRYQSHAIEKHFPNAKDFEQFVADHIKEQKNQ